MKYTFLTEKFYKDYPHNQYPQMEIKEDRPYAHVTVELYKRAKVDLTVSHRDDILKFSTLQYFEEYIYSDESNKDTN